MDSMMMMERPSIIRSCLASSSSWLMLLLVGLLLSLVQGDMTVSIEDKTLLVALDKPAGFGPRIEGKGIRGRLVLATPDLYACSPLDLTGYLPATETPDALPLIVLLQRSPVNKVNTGNPLSCTFDTKVRNAEAAGAELAIVFDSAEEPLIRMMSTSDAPVNIPSVFISQETGVALMDLFKSTPASRMIEVFVDTKDPFPILFDTLNLTMLGLIIGFLLIVLVLEQGRDFKCLPQKQMKSSLCPMCLLYQWEKDTVVSYLYTKRCDQSDPGPSTHLCLQHKTEVTVGSKACKYDNESCPVCLEDYKENETLKLLPCRHAFHTDCIAPWLTERQKTCPLCKESVGASPSTPLLRPSEATDAEGRRGDDQNGIIGGAEEVEGGTSSSSSRGRRLSHDEEEARTLATEDDEDDEEEERFKGEEETALSGIGSNDEAASEAHHRPRRPEVVVHNIGDRDEGGRTMASSSCLSPSQQQEEGAVVRVV